MHWKLGKKGGSQRLNLEVVERLKVMFLQGNVNKNMKLSGKDMLENSKIWAMMVKLKKKIYQSIPKLKVGFQDLINNIKKKLALQAHSSLTSTWKDYKLNNEKNIFNKI